ncbi:MAG: tetratricopeptide repeat protein, partial [Candidatus Acidiferrales bacterium]
MADGFPQSYRRLAAVALPIAAAIWLSYGGVKHALAGHFANSSNAGNWVRAARIEPGNAENWYRLGRYFQLDFVHSDLSQAVSDYRRAVQLNPWSPYYKLDLASALEMSGEFEEADKYYRAAQYDYPISSEVSWKYGNFLLRRQRMSEAYAEIHRAVEVTPSLIPAAISRVWHSDPDVHFLLDQVLPDTAAADWDAIDYLSGVQDPAAALAVWNHLAAKRPSIEWRQTFGLLDMLVAQGRYDDAGSVWRQAVSLSGGAPPTPASGSLIYNGGFEKDLAGGGFGWQQSDVPGATFDFDTDVKRSGARSARITFDGTQNLKYINLFQQVLVTPGTHYRFRGFLRTDQITTDSGVRFEIYDPQDPKNLDIVTPNERDTQSWT